MNMELLKLKNGSEEASVLVTAVMMSVRGLFQSDPIAFYELVQLCRDREHKLFGNASVALRRLSLIEDHVNGFGVHDSIRNIVLSAVEGDGLDMKLSSPVQTEAEQAAKGETK